MVVLASDDGISFAIRAIRPPETATSMTWSMLLAGSSTCPPFRSKSYRVCADSWTAINHEDATKQRNRKTHPPYNSSLHVSEDFFHQPGDILACARVRRLFGSAKLLDTWQGRRRLRIQFINRIESPDRSIESLFS